MSPIYLDHAAAAPLRPGVWDVVTAVSGGGNPSSLHAAGRTGRAAIDRARAVVAGVLGTRPREVIFCSGGTEANVEGILGLARARGPAGRLLVSAAEHSCVLGAAARLRGDGWTVEVLEVGAGGAVDPGLLHSALAAAPTDIVSLIYANNELGTINPIRALADLAKSAGALVHTDAVQAPGQLELRPSELGVDSLSLAAHKFGGPFGCGIVYLRDGTPFAPPISGSQEAGRRPGTENAPAIAGAAAALEMAEAARGLEAARLRDLRDAFESRVFATVPDVLINAQGSARLGSISSLSFRGVLSAELLVSLDLEGVCFSAGSACASGSSEPSHVLRAIRAPQWAQWGVIRFSFGHTTTERDAMHVAGMLPSMVARLREREHAEVVD